jgi:hypothetical protein
MERIEDEGLKFEGFRLDEKKPLDASPQTSNLQPQTTTAQPGLFDFVE